MEDETEILIFIKNIEGITTSINIRLSDNVETLFEKISVPADKYSFIQGFHYLENNKSIGSYRVLKNDILCLAPKPSPQVERNALVFEAIKAFVVDVDDGFGKKYKPVALYKRLTDHITPQNTSAIEKHIKVFKTFFDANPSFVVNGVIDTNGKISYTDRIFINISHVKAKLDNESFGAVRKHLLTIFSLLNLGNKMGKEALDALKSAGASAGQPILGDLKFPDTKEGRFVGDTLTQITKQFESIGKDKKTADNPMAAVASIVQSDFFPKFMGELQGKFASGEMNMPALMQTVMGAIGSIAPPGSAEEAQMSSLLSAVGSPTLATFLGGNQKSQTPNQEQEKLPQQAQIGKQEVEQPPPQQVVIEKPSHPSKTHGIRKKKTEPAIVCPEEPSESDKDDSNSEK